MPPVAGDCVIGVDLGGSKLAAGVIDADLRVRHRAFRAAPTTGVLDALEEVARELIATSEEPVAAVGMGIPSLMDHAEGVARWTNHLELAGVAVADVMADRLDLPVFVDNDGNLAMLAEHRAGAAAGCAHAVMLTLGTGIGSAMIIDNRLVRGAHGSAGEWGHVVVDLDGPVCPGNCPNRGCLEAVASGTALAVEGDHVAANDRDGALGRAQAEGRPITGALVTELAHDGDPGARSAVEAIGRRLGVGLASIANALDPEVIVIGGGVIACGDLLLEPGREEMRRRALPPVAETVRVEPARFGAESGMLGAALLARGHG